MELEETKPDGLCVGKPAVEGSVKIIRVSDGTLYTCTYTCTVCTFTLILFAIDNVLLKPYYRKQKLNCVNSIHNFPMRYNFIMKSHCTILAL